MPWPQSSMLSYIYLEIGYGPGGANDVWGRTIAKHMGNYIPGRPRVIVQNVPGAGGLTLMNQLYNISPKDGTFIGLINRGSPVRAAARRRRRAVRSAQDELVGKSRPGHNGLRRSQRRGSSRPCATLLAKDLLVGAIGSGATPRSIWNSCPSFSE
jgi:hypothetical protein